MIPRQKRKQDTPKQLVNAFGWDAQEAIPELKINPYEVWGADRSKHGAMLGRIAGQDVVVKPHVNREKGQRELQTMHDFTAHNLNTPIPMGIYEGRKASYLVTEKYEGLTALNSLRLRVASNERKAREGVSIRTVRSARAAAYMHNAGAVHGDYQARNSFEGPYQEPVYGDLENGYVGSRGKADIDRRGCDLYMLGASLVNSGYLYNSSLDYRSGAIAEIILGPYADVVKPGTASNIDLVESAIRYTIRTNRIEPFGKFVNGIIPL